MKFESSILTSKNSRIRLNNDYSEPISTRDSRQICNNDFSFRDFCILSIHRLFQTNISSINVVIDIGKKKSYMRFFSVSSDRIVWKYDERRFNVDQQRQVNIFCYFIDENTEKNCIFSKQWLIQRTNNEIIEIDHKQVSPRYTIDIYLSSTYVFTSLPTFSSIGYRLSRHIRTFTGKHLFFSSSANNRHHRSSRNSISSPREFAKRCPLRSLNTIVIQRRRSKLLEIVSSDRTREIL